MSDIQLQLSLDTQGIEQGVREIDNLVTSTFSGVSDDIQVGIEIDDSQIQIETKELRDIFDSALQGIGEGFQETIIDGLNGLIEGIGGQFGQIIEKGSNLEQISIAFETITGSAEAGQAAIEDLVDFAASTPFELPSIQKSGQSLLAFGFQARDLTEVLGRVGNVAAGVSQPIDELAVIYGKARVSGRLFAEDINQLTERGIPIIQELAKQFGVTEGEVKGLVESGQVGFENLEQAFVDLTSEGGSFFNLMERQSESVGGKISNFGDNVGKLQTQIFDAIAPVLSGGLDAANKLLNGIISLIDGFQKLPAPIQLALVGVTGFTATLSAGIVVYSAYQIASQTTTAQLVKENAVKTLATANQVKDTLATTAATAAKTAYAIATGKATAAQTQLIATLLKSAATLGLVAGAAASILAVVDTFNQVDESASETRERTDSLRKTLEGLGETDATQGMQDLSDILGGQLADDIEQARGNLNTFQRTLDDLIRSRIPGMATAAEASANRNAVAFGDLISETDDVLDVFDRFRAEGLEGQSQEDIEMLTAAIDEAQAAINNSEIPESMRGSAEIYIQSLEQAREELQALQAEAEAEQPTIEDIDQRNEMNSEERDLGQDEAIAAVRQAEAERVISAEEAQQRITQIRREGLADELAAIESQISQIDTLKEQGLITEEEAIERRNGLLARAADIETQQAEAAIAAREEANAELIAAEEQRVSEESAIRDRQQTEAIAAIRRQQADRLISEEQATAQIAQVRREGLADQLSAIEEQQAGIDELREQGAISEEEYRDRQMELEGRAAEVRLSQINAEIEAQDNLMQAQLDRIDEVAAAEQLAAEQATAQLDAVSQGLEQQNSILSARAGLQQAQNDLANSRLQAEIDAAEAAGDSAEAEELRGELLENQARQLERQQTLELEQLRISHQQEAIDINRQQIAAQLATAEAELAIQRAQTEGASAQEIENLQQQLELTRAQESLIAGAAASQAELNQLAEQELLTRQQIASEDIDRQIDEFEGDNQRRQGSNSRTIGGGDLRDDQPRGVSNTPGSNLNELLSQVNQGTESNRAFLDTALNEPRESIIPGLNENFGRIEGLLSEAVNRLSSTGNTINIETQPGSNVTDPAELAKIARALE